MAKQPKEKVKKHLGEAGDRPGDAARPGDRRAERAQGAQIDKVDDLGKALMDAGRA